MRKYAVPCIISLLVGAFYNIVDQIFIANAAYLGSYGNAANTVVWLLCIRESESRTGRTGQGKEKRRKFRTYDDHKQPYTLLRVSDIQQ